ncbi:sulfatase-like hydrolase/transferase [Streptomyces sp. A7024]|uniref:Sulfatase-like hydrolase/transferase n=1 Tax=Streptomyces coryli TaxID=1128680 RepID=A0A6G4U2B6_9ACTN|nr:sulfatase-like hydrolase/transferase [Streptomyces coryli]NGN66365.1 sulfatase-like hydrolase/transferase [Streptomyces coryli]
MAGSDRTGHPTRAILVFFDTLNRRFLPPYGNDWVHAPNFRRLAERSATFGNCYGGSMPCIPARRELHTGRYNFLHRSWGPLEPFDDSMPRLLGEHGVHSHLATDHQHYFEDGGATYHTRYSTWEFFRGQEGDPWKGQLADPDIPEAVRLLRGERWRQDWINRGHLEREEDHPQSRTFDAGLDFIEANHAQDNWFLQIETFDPHEPFFTYKQYKDLYPHAYDGPHADWPDYQRTTERPQAVEHVRYEYAALLSMCDRSLGRVLDAMDAHGMWDDTLLIVGTDHGFLLGEHGWWGKNIQPWYDENIHTPLFVWDPRTGVRGERRDSLVQTIDLAPTLLEYFGVERPQDMQGVPLRETTASDVPVREAALFGSFGGHVNVTDGRYVYMRASASEDNAPLYEYTLLPTRMKGYFAGAELRDAELAAPFSFTKDCPVLRVPVHGQRSTHHHGSLLFDLDADPRQERPLVDDEVELRMAGLLTALMRANDAPASQFERLGLPREGDVTREHLLVRRQRASAERAAAALPDEDDLPQGRIHLRSPLSTLLAEPAATAAIETAVPGLLSNPRVATLGHVTLRELAAMAPAVLDGPRLRAIAEALATVP